MITADEEFEQELVEAIRRLEMGVDIGPLTRFVEKSQEVASFYRCANSCGGILIIPAEMPQPICPKCGLPCAIVDLPGLASPFAIRRAQAHFKLGIAAARRDDFDTAMTELQLAIQAYPNYSNARYNLGEVLIRLGKFREAERELDTVIKLSPCDAMAFNNRGMARCKLGNLIDGHTDISHALVLDPNHAMAYFNRGCAAHAFGDLVGACEDWMRYLKLEPDGEYAAAATSYLQRFGSSQRKVGIVRAVALTLRRWLGKSTPKS